MNKQPHRDDDTPTPVSLETLNQRLKTIVETKTKGKPVEVRGRATDVSRKQSKHVHLRLRQDECGMDCVVFRSVARKLPFWIENGQTLLIQGEVKVDPVWGELQIVAHRVELETPKRRKDRPRSLKAQAEEAGWLDRSTRRPLPRPPRVVGLITGERSKARADVIGSFKDAGIQPEVVFEPAAMQGPESIERIKTALAALNENARVDVIVIARGGGSKAELARFNDLSLVQAIYESRLPVVTAIGHRRDQSLADHAADRAAPTPSSVGSVLARRPAFARPPALTGQPVLAKRPVMPRQPAPAAQSEEQGNAAVVAVVILVAIFLCLVGRAAGWW